MRRRDIQLLASARQGDAAARCEAGRRYLLGVDGFARHLSTGLDYLSHPSLAGSTEASIIIAESLPLNDIIRFGQHGVLLIAASSGSELAQLKLGAWSLLTATDATEAQRWLEPAAQAGHAGARRALAELLPSFSIGGVLAAMRALSATSGIDCAAVAMLAVASATARNDAALMARSTTLLLRLSPSIGSDAADQVCAVLERAEQLPCFEADLDTMQVERCLESCATRGNAQATLILGKALCGIDHGPLRALALVTGQNMRKGAALLLRAADAGKEEAWRLLFRVHSDRTASVANPELARFFLEKAATRGDMQAQRRLGALILRQATALHETEHGIHWLYEAAQKEDAYAAGLLRSLVLPVAGDEAAASAAIEAIRREDPWMACRLRTARDFGLTRLEALSIDLANGIRPWGLVVGRNPFIVQTKLSAPRAVPALTTDAMGNLRRSVAFFEQSRQSSGSPVEGDLRKRSHRLRRLLDRHGVDESLFFSDASSTRLNSLRSGAKWAFHARQPLRQALGA